MKPTKSNRLNTLLASALGLACLVGCGEKKVERSCQFSMLHTSLAPNPDVLKHAEQALSEIVKEMRADASLRQFCGRTNIDPTLVPLILNNSAPLYSASWSRYDSPDMDSDEWLSVTFSDPAGNQSKSNNPFYFGVNVSYMQGRCVSFSVGRIIT
jgi:hypothetical protein